MSNQQGFRSLSTFKKELHRLKSLFATVPLSHRQIEILCILALHPHGIGLEELHYALYGERIVSLKNPKG